MEDQVQIETVENPEETAWGMIGRSLQKFNVQQVGESHFQRICFVLRGSDGEFAGGIFGATYWGWLFVDLMWVKDELRGCGYGQRLLQLAEDEARKRGVKGAYLDTFSFQALNFYKKNGYQVFGELQDFPPGHQRYFLTKRL